MKKILFVTFWCAVASIFTSMSAVTITGRVIDGADKSGLVEATVKLLAASADSTMVKGVTTDDDGYFWMTDVKPGHYVVNVSYMGYKNLNKAITVAVTDSKADAGVLAMKASTIVLKETTVVGVKTEIKVKQDTIEYNAGSYQTQPNAVVEDLLKRLPGVQVGTDGKVTANGKEVSKILVDGKEFFSSDTKVGTKNIPVKIVDKVQVVDRKSDLARLTGVDDGEDETVINLTVKKGMNNGWFGNLTAGYGTDNRYTGSLMLNRFQDGNQFTLLAGGNNTNEQGFTNGASSRFTQFGGGNNGINKTQNVGMNFNVGNGDKFRVGGDVMYSHSDQDTWQKNDRQYLFTDSTSYSRSNSLAHDRSHNIVGNFRMRWEVDSFNVMEFRPNFSFNFNKSTKNDTSITLAGDPMQTVVNRSKNSYDSHGSNYEFGGEWVFNHKFKSHPGRSYSVDLRYNFSNRHEDGSTYTDNRYYLIDNKDEIIDQVYSNHVWSNSVQTRLTWTEPLGNVKNGRFLNLSYRAQYRFNNADKMVYDITGAQGVSGNAPSYASLLGNGQVIDYIKSEYTSFALTNPTLLNEILKEEVLNAEQSNQFRNDFFTQTIQAGYYKVSKKYTLDMGLSLNPSMSESKNLIDEKKSIPTRWVWNLAPYARYRYRMSNTRSLAFDYRAQTNQPTMAQLQPVADVSNPLRIVVGNPDLNPTFTQRFNIRYNDYNTTEQRSLMAMLGAQMASNSIISKTDYDRTTGGQTTTYANVNGVWNANAMGMISFPLPNNKFYYSTNLAVRYSNTKGYNNGEINRSGTVTLSISPGLAFRTDNFDIELRPNYNLQSTHNSVQQTANQTVNTYGGMLNVNYYLPIGLTLGSDVNYSGTSGYSAGYNTNQWLWNGSISYEFLKSKAATLTAKVYDILHQRQSISRNVTANYIQDSEYNSLTRYVMFTFAYRFNTFGGSKNIPKNNYDGFMRGNRGGGGFHGGGRVMPR